MVVWLAGRAGSTGRSTTNHAHCCGSTHGPPILRADAEPCAKPSTCQLRRAPTTVERGSGSQCSTRTLRKQRLPAPLAALHGAMGHAVADGVSGLPPPVRKLCMCTATTTEALSCGSTIGSLVAVVMSSRPPPAAMQYLEQLFQWCLWNCMMSLFLCVMPYMHRTSYPKKCLTACRTTAAISRTLYFGVARLFCGDHHARARLDTCVERSPNYFHRHRRCEAHINGLLRCCVSTSACFHRRRIQTLLRARVLVSEVLLQGHIDSCDCLVVGSRGGQIVLPTVWEHRGNTARPSATCSRKGLAHVRFGNPHRLARQRSPRSGCVTEASFRVFVRVRGQTGYSSAECSDGELEDPSCPGRASRWLEKGRGET